MIDPSLYDEARDRIAAAGFTPAIQTKIALVLSTAKSGNLMFNASLQWMPKLGLAKQFIISQSSRELEAITLLASTTIWDRDVALVFDAGRITAPLMMAWGQIMMPPGPAFSPPAGYRGLSLGHAQLARLRLTPVIPDNLDPLDPFAIVVQRIEQENGRMLQTQIRLLKSIGTETALDQREALVEKDQALVDAVVSQFLAWLAAP
jgi:hypothetical protein